MSEGKSQTTRKHRPFPPRELFRVASPSGATLSLLANYQLGEEQWAALEAFIVGYKNQLEKQNAR